MKPRSLSATALQVAELCMARYTAENFHYSKGMGGMAASLGTACHGALELFVKSTKLDGHPENWNLPFLLDMYRLSYMESFGTSDCSGEVYEDGVDMLKRWYERTDLGTTTVLSAEIKSNFMVPTTQGDIPFNYVWDRFDELGDGQYRVVDYKTNRWGLRPEDLKKKIQARCYGLAAAIQLKNMGLEYERIWVEFDLLRHSSVGIVFTREENIATWQFIKDSAEKILATDPNNPPETLNNECRFCVRKQACKALKKNITVGGVFSVATAQDAVDLRAAMQYQMNGLAAAIKELDDVILADAKAQDVLEFESDMNRLKIGVSSRKSVDAERAEMILGPTLFHKYGKASITMADVNKLLKGSELTEEQKKALKAAIYNKIGEPSVKVEPKNSLEDE
jgi:hypothetical protein